MKYKFGDVFDCRRHTRLAHYQIILGNDTKKNQVLYYVLTSRIYKAFDKLCSFFNRYCIDGKCDAGRFERHFKDKGSIKPVNLFDVFFVDKNMYKSKLSEDSMIIMNTDLRTEDIKAFDYKIKNNLKEYSFNLSQKDIYRLYTHIRTSDYISDHNLKLVKKSFNLVK